MSSTDNTPVHVAIIPDGNRRWARGKNLPTIEGHRRGYNNMVDISKKAREMGIKVLTLWGFSTENWNRTQDEVGYLMQLFERWIDSHVKQAIKDEVRIRHIGRKDRINKTLLAKILQAEEKTKHFDKYHLNIAIDYGGRDEILRAVKRIVDEKIKSEDVTQDVLNQFIDTAGMPDADLIIRTGDEQRTSGFLIWQGAYAEYLYVNKYFPDYLPADFEDSIEVYKQRNRRFGK